MTAPALPDIELAELADLEARPACEMRWDCVPCPRPAVWRGRSSCPACGRVFSDLVCTPCRQRWDEIEWSTNCCRAVPSRYVWTLL